MKITLVTYFYNDGIKYLNTFLDSIKKQTHQAFKLTVFNDGVNNAANYFTNFTGEIEFVDVSGTPTEIRFQSFDYLYKTNAEYIIFQDIDDGMTENRVEVLSELLQKYDIVSNDLSLMDDNGTLYKTAIWSDRLPDLFEFTSDFIKDKNIAGIGNSGIRKSVLSTPIKYSALPKVADWFMFYQLMFFSKVKAVFTSKCQTLYRQHNNNMAGVKTFDEARLTYVIQVKRAHYLGLQEIGIDVTKELTELDKIELIIQNKIAIPKDNLFWWEETNHLVIN